MASPAPPPLPFLATVPAAPTGPFSLCLAKRGDLRPRFFVISVDGPICSAQYGRIGVQGFHTAHPHESPSAAAAHARDLIQRKLAQGYEVETEELWTDAAADPPSAAAANAPHLRYLTAPLHPSAASAKKRARDTATAPAATKKRRKVCSSPADCTFCVTGTLSEVRDAFHRRLRAAGAAVSARVTADCTHLVVGADGEDTAKYRKAEELGVEIVSEEWVKELLSPKETSPSSVSLASASEVEDGSEHTAEGTAHTAISAEKGASRRGRGRSSTAHKKAAEEEEASPAENGSGDDVSDDDMAADWTLTGANGSYLCIPVGATKLTLDELLSTRGKAYSLGTGYYEVGGKTENVSASKHVVLIDRKTQRLALDDQSHVRSLLGLGASAGKVNKHACADYYIYVQSTSRNRNLLPHTHALFKMR